MAHVQSGRLARRQLQMSDLWSNRHDPERARPLRRMRRAYQRTKSYQDSARRRPAEECVHACTMHLVLFFADDQAQTALGVLADHDLCVCSAGLERSVAGPAGSAEGIMGTGDLVQRQHAVLFADRALHVRNLLVHHRLVQRTCAGRHHGFEFPGVGCPAAPGSPAAADWAQVISHGPVSVRSSCTW